MGVKDTWYCALFAKEDLPSIYRLAEKIRLTHDQRLVDGFNSDCERKFNDHNPIINGIEFLNSSKSEDLPVNGGLYQCCLLITGTNSTRYQYMGNGLSTAIPLSTQSGLVTEVLPRTDMSLFGWREWASTSLKFGAIFGESLPSTTVNEGGVFTAATGGNMLNRSTFLALPISHTVNVTGFVLSSVVEFVPVM